jgi:hypothetical protein
MANATHNMKMTTQKAIRAQFWASHPALENHARKWGIKTAPQNRHNTDTRTAFSDFVDYLAKSGMISEKLASRATL